MARRAKMNEPDDDNQDGEDEGSELLADPNDRAKLIKRTRSKISRLQGEVDQLNESAKPKKKEISAAFRTLKSKTGLTRKEAEHVFWQLDLEDGDRDASQSRIREAFAACGYSEQPAGRTEIARARKQDAENKASNGAKANHDPDGGTDGDAFNRGYDSDEREEMECPYKKGTKLAREWEAGRSKKLSETQFDTAPN